GRDIFPADNDRVDEHRSCHLGEEKEGGNKPNSPLTERGEENSKSPRTRRMRPQRDSVT
ncbi:unnamed protein product, partial [Pylaiella littoralis]